MMKGGGGSSTSTSTSGRIDKEEEAKETTASTMSSSSWGTWEELLLACAVKRHGVEDWESVAMEVQAKTSLPHLMTNAHSCKLKYEDLQRRFNNQNQNDDVDAAAAVPWLDDLKKLRFAQLRHDLHRYDNSIMSLQLKVKRLEEERQEQGRGEEEAQDLKTNDHELKPDLEEHGLRRSENDKPYHHQSEPDRSKQPLDHENQSVNGSNSTCSKSQDHNKHGLLTTEPKPLPTGLIEPDSESAETVRRQGESSEAQSSASLTRRSERKRRRTIDDLRDQPPVNQQLVLGKSQPLVEILQMIRAHQHSSFFERRLPSQESDKYKRMVQQHLDLETIQTKLNKDSYSSTSTLTFYRDLLLLFTNAVVFFPKSSTESVTGHKLRRLVLNEMKKNNLITRPAPSSSGPSDSLPPQDKRTDYHELERSDSLLAKHKSTAPIIVCRKRSSISSKPSTLVRKVATTTTTTDQEEKKPALELKPANDKDNASNSKLVGEEHLKRNAAAATVSAAKTKEKIVTGTRSSRRTSLHEKNGSASKKKSSSPGETPKSDKKKKTPQAGVALDKKRSGAAADFLKRMKRNSPVEKLKVKSGTSTPPKDAQQKKRGGGKVVDKVTKERVSRQSGGENKKQVKEESSPSKRGRRTKKATEAAAVNVVSRKRSRDSGGKQQQEASRRPKKRSRR